MCLFCDVALEGKANWISVSCPLKAEVLMLLINLSRNHLPHISSVLHRLASLLVLKAYVCQKG